LKVNFQVEPPVSSTHLRTNKSTLTSHRCSTTVGPLALVWGPNGWANPFGTCRQANTPAGSISAKLVF
jgi:hypothetical protein